MLSTAAGTALKLRRPWTLTGEKLEKFGREYGVPGERLYTSWEECLAAEKFADAVINATPDRIHYRSTMAALEKGYHVLLEKPMAQTEAQCREMVEKAEEKGLLLMVCHVLRYAGFFEKLKELYDAGAIGQLIHLELTEHESFWHHAHSYVRGSVSPGGGIQSLDLSPNPATIWTSLPT